MKYVLKHEGLWFHGQRIKIITSTPSITLYYFVWPLF